ncbi:hypothetical protein HAX54_003034, partial [Datura stramonium]|nr:hypothetical protein [Datura stramonium]
MARTRNSNNNAPTAATAKQIEHVVQEQVARLRPTTVPTQVVMPPEMGEAFNAIKGAMEMFTTFMANQGQEVVIQVEIAKVMGASLARIRTSELQSLRVRVVLGSHPTRKSLIVLARRAIQVIARAGYEVLQLLLLQHLPQLAVIRLILGVGADRGLGSMIQGGRQPRLYAALDRRSVETSSVVVT